MGNLWMIGAGSEIGQQIVLELNARQELDHVILASRNLENLKQFVLKHKLAGKADVKYVDLTDNHSIDCFVQEAAAPNEIIVCAGYLYSESPIAYGQLRKVMDTNLTGVIYLLEQALPALRQYGGGSVAVFSSVAGEQGSAENKYYAAAKAGLNIYMEGFQKENAKFGIRTIVFKPGYIQTKMLRKKDLLSRGLAVSPQTAAEKCVAYMRKEKSLIVFVPAYWKWILFWGKVKRKIFG